MSRWTRLVVCVAALVVYDGCYSQCDAACVGGVDVTIRSTSTRFTHGRYKVVADIDGVRTTTECTTEPQTSTCNGGGAAAAPTNDGALVVRINGTPRHVELTVAFADAIVAEVAFDPQYTEKDEICGRTCYGATHSVRVP